jgi:hypothetical protein
VEGLDANVGAVQTALEQAPEVLHGVGVDVLVHILYRMVDNGVFVIRLQPIVGEQLIGEDRGTGFDMLTHVRLKFLLAATADDESANFAATFDHSHSDGLILTTSAGNHARTLRLVHIARLAADHAFIYLYFTGELPSIVSLMREPNTVQHEPRGLLSDSQVTVNFIARDAVLAVGNQPHARMPNAALPAQLVLQEAYGSATTNRADHAVLPLRTASDKVVKAVLLVGEVNDGFLQGLRVVRGFHTLSIPQKAVLSKYVNAYYWGRSMFNQLFTIGHSNHPIDLFIRLLVSNGVEAVVDTRSYPKSQFAPQYNEDVLCEALRERGIKYLYMGKELGGRPRGAQYYDNDGRVFYSRVAGADFFLQGLQRLEHGVRKFKMALLCSEENPSVCHRRLLISRVLKQRGFAIWHIRADGRVQAEEDLLAEEALDTNDSQLALFPSTQSAPEWKSIPSVLPKKQRSNSSQS